MRFSEEQINILKNKIISILPDAIIYLFGSRTDDNQKGGDIDIMILSHKKINWKEKSIIRWHFFEKFGEQKLDIVSFTFEEKDAFKQIILENGIKL